MDRIFTATSFDIMSKKERQDDAWGNPSKKLPVSARIHSEFTPEIKESRQEMQTNLVATEKNGLGNLTSADMQMNTSHFLQKATSHLLRDQADVIQTVDLVKEYESVYVYPEREVDTQVCNGTHTMEVRPVHV